MSMNRIHRGQAFTLIELLVVIAIISVLAALLFTALSGSRQKSNQTVSLNNLKQWGSALEMSLADFDGRMPSDGLEGDTANLKDNDAWFNRLPPYLKLRALNDPETSKNPPKPTDRSIWINPAAPDSLFRELHSPPEKYLFCYAMNDYLSPSTDSGSDFTERTLPKTKVENLSATVFMVEQGDSKPAARSNTIRAFFGNGDPKTSPDNSAHFLFCDGHIELRTRKEWDPQIMKTDDDNPSTEDTERLNKHITFIPFTGATP